MRRRKHEVQQGITTVTTDQLTGWRVSVTPFVAGDQEWFDVTVVRPYHKYGLGFSGHIEGHGKVPTREAAQEYADNVCGNEVALREYLGAKSEAEWRAELWRALRNRS